jgi:hypothetical protein
MNDQRLGDCGLGSREQSFAGQPRARDLALARRRVRAVAQGGTINLTYRMSPEPALEAFRADLLLILDQESTS